VGVGKNYTDRAAFNADLQRWQEEKAAREEQMKLRRKALERQREKQRDRSGRQRPTEDSERRVQQRREMQAANTDVATVRAARDQLRAARSRPIPRVTASSYNTLIELTNKLLKGGASGVRGGEDASRSNEGAGSIGEMLGGHFATPVAGDLQLLPLRRHCGYRAFEQ